MSLLLGQKKSTSHVILKQLLRLDNYVIEQYYFQMPEKPNFTSTLLSFYISFFLIFWCKPMIALPQGGSVIAGSATISNPSANLLQINQDTQRAIINWNSFSISNGQTTQFIQPGSKAAVLNRVTGGNPTDIYGQLKANGAVYLVNQNGITIGPSGVIDVNTFVASTLNVNNSDFMGAGDLIFKGNSSAKVTNMGTINALDGDVFLIGRQVNNSGNINAPRGTVGIAAGDPAEGEDELEVLLKSSGDQRIFIRVRKVKEDKTEEEQTDEGGENNVVTDENSDDLSGNENFAEEGDQAVTETLVENENELDDVVVNATVEVISTDSETGPIEVVEIIEDGDNESEIIVAQTLDIDGVAFEVEYEYVWEAIDTISNVGQIVSDSIESELAASEPNVNESSSDSNNLASSIVQDANIINTGVINAVQAELRAVGGNQYALAINNTGEIRATGVDVDESGNVSLVAKTGDINNTGVISAQNSNGDGGSVLVQAERGTASTSGIIDVSAKTPDGVGGNVQVLGREVAVIGNALIDASGDSGGGEILVGGDKLGLNPEIQNALKTVFENTARIAADANVAGDGGKVIVYADGTTQFDGMVTARGGIVAGNGGLIESSGKENITFDLENSVPDARARAEGYESGEWLIDPYNITITASTTTAMTGSPFFNPTGSGAILDIADINSALGAGTSVNVTTSNGGGAEAGNITWDSTAILDFNGTGNSSLSLNADNDILYRGKIYDSVLDSESLNVTFNAGNDITFDGGGTEWATIYTEGGDVTLSAGNDISINGNGANSGKIDTYTGDISLQSSGGGTISTSSAILNSGGGTISASTDRNIIATSTSIDSSGGVIDFNAIGSVLGDYKGLEINGGSLSSGSGTMYLNGEGGNGATGNYGVLIHNNASLMSTDGNINISGKGANNTSGTYQYGVKIVDASTSIGSTDGRIAINGQGGNSVSGGENVGVYIGTSALVSSTNGPVRINGTGGSGATGNNHGVWIENSGKVSSTDGSIFIDSTAGSTGASPSRATLLDSGGTVESTGSAIITFLAAANPVNDAAIKIGNTSIVGSASNTGDIKFFLDTDVLDLSNSPMDVTTATGQVKSSGFIDQRPYGDFNPPPPPRDGPPPEDDPPPPPLEEEDPFEGKIIRNRDGDGRTRIRLNPNNDEEIDLDDLFDNTQTEGPSDLGPRARPLEPEGELGPDGEPLDDRPRSREQSSFEGDDGEPGELDSGEDGEGRGPNENGPASDEADGGENETDSEEGNSPADREGADNLDQQPQPRNGTDTSFDDQVMLPGEVIGFGQANMPPPPLLDTATAPIVRSNLGNTNTVTANVPPPQATPVPPPVPPAPPALDVLRVNPGQTMNLGGSPIPPPPQIQLKLDVSVSPSIANSLRNAM